MLSNGEPPALRAGRERYQRERRAQAIARVAAYERWLKAGSPLRKIPAVPSSADYRWARSR